MPIEPGFDLFVPGQYLKQALAVSLLSVWVLVGLFFYLNHYTKRRYFTIWATAWLFYALWLSLNFGLGYPDDQPLMMMIKQWCISTVALFLLWGSARFLGQRVRQLSFGLFMAFLFTWSFYGAYHLEDDLQIRMPIFGLIALASFKTAWGFFIYRRSRRYIGAGLLAIGFILWGAFHAGYPLLYRVPELFGAGFFIATVLQLFIAVSMIVQVLEEARNTHNLAYKSLSEQSEEKSRLLTRAALSEERYRHLFDKAGESIVVVTCDQLRILEINQAASKMLGISPEAAHHRHLTEFCVSVPPAPLSHAWQWLRSQHPLLLRHADGSTLALEVAGSEISCDGQEAVELFIRPQPPPEASHQQLRQTEKLAALGKMISGIAHELNNPLTVVKGYLEVILSQRQLDPNTRAELEKVANESNRAAKLVQHFLAFARERPPERGTADLNALVRQVLELRMFAIQSAGVEVETRLAPELPPTVADADQIKQVLIILVHNAVQAMAEQSRGGKLKISTHCAQGFIVVAVSDTGPGVAKHLEEKIFEPFFSTKEAGMGSGLGLSIAHSILTEHQGRIYHRRPPEGGACFVMELPIVEPPARNAEQEEEGASFDLAPLPRPLTILVLDDEKIIADLLGEMLSLLGCKALCCTSSVKALELIRQHSFDLIVSDIRMPGMDGRQFYLVVQKLDPELASRIIFLTGDTLGPETRDFLQSVGNIHLTKPFQLSALRAALEKHASNPPHSPPQ